MDTFGNPAGMEYDKCGTLCGRLEWHHGCGESRAGQFISYRDGGKTEAYAYDALGNRTSKILDGVQKAAYRYNALSQLISMTAYGVAYGFGYDRCGNLTEERRGESVVRQYAYDAAGRMALGKNPEAGEESVYSYNALGMCAWETCGRRRRKACSVTGRCSTCRITWATRAVGWRRMKRAPGA